MCPIQEQLEVILAEITSTLEKTNVSDSSIAAQNKKLEEVKGDVENTKKKSLANLDKEETEAICNVKEKYDTMRNQIKSSSEESISICDVKIARNKVLKESIDSKLNEKEALTMIPISSCIEAAEGFLTSIREADQSAIQQVDAEKEGEIMYFEANQGFVFNTGCVKSTSVAAVKQTVAVVDHTVDKSRPHYKNGRNVKVGDRVVKGTDWRGTRTDVGTVIKIGKNDATVEWDAWKTVTHNMTDKVYKLQLANQQE